MQKTLSMDNVDPHFARLLSSLSLSASKPSIEDVVEGAVPALESVHGAIPHYPSEHSVSSSTNSSSQSGTARPSQSSRTPSTNPRTPPASTPHVSFTHNPQIARQSTPSLVQQQQQQRPLVIPKGSMAPVSPSTVRRISGSVDVSPYLARASTAAPPVPKQLKYISMLESVAKESERMTPKIERQLAARGDFLTMPGPHIGPPPVLPPGASYGPPGDSSVIYSSAQRPQRGFQPQPYPPYHHAQMPPDDAFIIRPRTSNNIHPAPYTSLSTRPSLSEDQLRAMMSAAGPRPPMPPVGPYHMPPPPHLAGPPRPGPPYLMAVPPVPAGRLPYPNLRLIPPQQLPPGQFAEQPLSAPAVSPAFNLIPRAKPAHNNAQLLSILNTPSLPRATPATSQPVLNPS
ncbi:hypothetical protein BDW22DRAFT_53111 [Trametopsis cervina]|nr:hypothetical protein BDW22DRAFT_53111 [Trametopsis cervina]